MGNLSFIELKFGTLQEGIEIEIHKNLMIKELEHLKL